MQATHDNPKINAIVVAKGNPNGKLIVTLLIITVFIYNSNQLHTHTHTHTHTIVSFDFFFLLYCTNRHETFK